jgi:hypothetical protein
VARTGPNRRLAAAGRAPRDLPRVSIEAAATPDAVRCPACDEPLFVWVETEGWGPREDQVIDRCENCGLVVAREAAGRAEGSARELASRLGAGDPVRTTNPASLQAWLGAENWAALRPGDRGLHLAPRSVELLAKGRQLGPLRVRQLAAPGIAAMWLTLLNLVTFHRDFAPEAVAGRLRPGTGRGRAAFAVDAAITILAGIPVAALAVLLEGPALLARRGGVLLLSKR